MKNPKRHCSPPKKLQGSNLKAMACVLRFLHWNLAGAWNFGLWDFFARPRKYTEPDSGSQSLTKVAVRYAAGLLR